ncbi:putative ABC transport system substrate-binding protein [Oceanospirillum multiglobuliferum]|uniref:ABC transporter substrate-binding protein n=1 Tax=Oceanospirillum multiglobuliferum TaxID=64969 RepID=A0A1T4MUG4_9GAMM|nr:ABC transporter substrate-binding protein [Oceanospirillum multiglobuliferum]OPX56891.1 hypothetical protein BTE48_00190 [Oceanospirillum multiglobuliferum]SJZ70484.1 putative ABC transport system substrate-binding protein [Oceanospirillum multiglobuliferum]
MKVKAIVFSLLLMLSNFSWAQTDANSSANLSAEPAAKRVYMVLWRGMTDAERGFIDSMLSHNPSVELIIRNANKNKANLSTIRADILRQQPDLVYSFGTTVTTVLAGTEQGRQKGLHITDIPLIFNIVADPMGAGLVSNYRAPAFNVTGTSHLVPMATQVAAMQEIEGVETVAVIYNSKEKNSLLQVDSLKAAIEAAKLKLVEYPLNNTADANAAESFATLAQQLKQQGVDIVYMPSDSYLISHAKTLVKAVHDQGIPVFSATEEPIRSAGAYMGVVSRYYNVGQFAAYKAEQILFDGKTVAQVPVETLKRFSFIVNIAAAKQLNRFPPVTIMQTAEVVGE